MNKADLNCLKDGRQERVRVCMASTESRIAIRFTIYTGFIASSCYALPWTIADGNIQEFTDNRWVEWVQFGLLVLVVAMWWAISRRAASRELYQLIGVVHAVAAFRELDKVLDRLIPVLGWKVGVLMAFVAFGLVLRGRGRQVARQIGQFLGTPAFVLGWSGFMLVIPIAQLIGHGPFLEALLGDHYDNVYKHVIEESAELMGYLMLVAAAVEGWVAEAHGPRAQSGRGPKTA